MQKLQNQLFCLEANFLELNGISTKKGCYIGQENTARMFLKNKITKRLLPIKILSGNILVNQKVFIENNEVGTILIGNPFPFALIKINNDNKKIILQEKFKTLSGTIKITIPDWLKFY